MMKDMLCKCAIGLLLIILLVPISSAQERIELYTPLQFLQQGYEASKEEDYTKALEYYSKIDPNDTLYNDALLQMVLSHRNLKNFKESIEFCGKGIELNEKYLRQFYLNKAISLDSLGHRDQMFNVMNTSAQLFPMDHWQHIYMYYFHRDHGHDDLALQSLQDGIKLNPLEPSLHALLGLVAAKSGQLTRSILPLTFACILNPEGDNTNSWLVSANTVASEKVDELDNSFTWNQEGENFEELDLLIKNFIALRKDYKTESRLEYALIKQLHLIIDQINMSQSGFWTDTYGPFLKNVENEGKFDQFTYLLSYSSQSEDHQRLFEREFNEIKEFHTWMYSQLHEQFRRQPSPDFVNGTDTVYCHYDDHELNAMTGYNEEYEKISGPYYYFGENGHVNIMGLLDETGGSTGFWKYYDENGLLYRTSNYLNNELNGETIFFQDNGEISSIRQFKDGKENGLTKRFKVIGHMFETTEYKNDKLEGEQTGYYANGSESYNITYSNDLAIGPFTYYHQDGQILAEGHFVEGEVHGLYKNYHENGQLNLEYQMNKGVLNGEYIHFFNNGQLAEKGTYVNGIKSGDWVEYDRLGNLREEEKFDEKGKLTGISKTYDINGNLWIEYEYIKERLELIRSFDTLGNIIHESKEKRGKLPFKVLRSNGLISVEGTFTDNEESGQWKRYNSYGQLLRLENYDNGVQEGLEVGYYHTGDTQYVAHYKSGELDSIFLQYHPNGRLHVQGNYSEGQLDGRYQRYSPLGYQVSDEYYIQGNLHGWQKYFSEEGKIYLKNKVNLGYPIRKIWYDQNMDTAGDTKLKHGEGVERMYFTNGQMGRERIFKGGEKNGHYKKYYPNGQLSYSETYVNDEEEGLFTTFYLNGQIQYQGNYKNGLKVDEFRKYDYYGNLILIEKYDHGLLHGQSTRYNVQGKIIENINYILGERHGPRKIYSHNGDLQFVLYYNDGMLVSFSGPEGKKKPQDRINLPKGSGTIKTSFENGINSCIGTYVNGKAEGLQETYYPNGVLNTKSNYTNGWLHGDRIYYYPDGTIKSKEVFNMGNRHGLCQYYYPSGSLDYTINYVNGDREGDAKRYKEDGTLLSYGFYFANNMVELK